jgi:hypothetical protein
MTGNSNSPSMRTTNGFQGVDSRLGAPIDISTAEAPSGLHFVPHRLPDPGPALSALKVTFDPLRPNGVRPAVTGLSGVVGSAVIPFERLTKFLAPTAVIGIEREQNPKASELYLTAPAPRQYPRCKDRNAVDCAARLQKYRPIVSTSARPERWVRWHSHCKPEEAGLMGRRQKMLRWAH